MNVSAAAILPPKCNRTCHTTFDYFKMMGGFIHNFIFCSGGSDSRPESLDIFFNLRLAFERQNDAACEAF